MAAKSYVVTGPLATPYTGDGSRIYLYQGSPVPDGLREGEVERFVDLGLFSEVETEDKPVAKKTAASK